MNHHHLSIALASKFRKLVVIINLATIGNPTPLTLTIKNAKDLPAAHIHQYTRRKARGINDSSVQIPIKNLKLNFGLSSNSLRTKVEIPSSSLSTSVIILLLFIIFQTIKQSKNPRVGIRVPGSVVV